MFCYTSERRLTNLQMRVQDIIDIFHSIKEENPEASFPDVWRDIRVRFLELAGERGVGSPDQSWKSTSGKAFEKITIEIILEMVEQEEFIENGITASSFYNLNARKKQRLSHEFWRRCVDKKVYVSSEPDIVIYKNNRPKVLVSCKSSLRDRVHMDLFWSGLYQRQGIKFTEVCAETSAEIGTCRNPRKPRNLAESIYDRLYIVNGDIDFCEVVRPFSDLESDLRRWLF